MKEIICYAINPPTIYENTFYNKSATLYVPIDCEIAYRNADYWNKFIIKITSQLEVLTVSPANGAEVESLNTITLTFAEAVTVNAEAGELTMVNTSDAAYDYAKNFNVTISEDGLIATITCVPGYLDRWAPGKTYKLNIPAGYFVATSGATSDALEYSWKIAAAKFTYIDVTPAQGEVTELSEILIGFANRAYGNSSLPTLNLVDANGDVVTTASTVRAQNANGDWYAIKVTLKDKVTAPGTYTLVVPADVFKDTELGDGVTNAAFDLTWTIKEVEVDSTTYDLVLTSDPTNGATVKELKTIKIYAADASVIAMPTTEAQSAGWFSITDANGNSYNSKIDLLGQYWVLTIDNAVEPGIYTVVIPKESFFDAKNQTNYNPEIILKYTLKAKTLAIPTVSPANGAEVESLNIITLTFAEAVTVNAEAGELTIVNTAVPNYDYAKNIAVTMSEDGLTATISCQPGYPGEDPRWTSNAIYKLNIPAGYFVATTGATSNAIKYSWTIAALVVENFTPVLSPAEGEVIADEIKKTVITLPSKFVAFDKTCDPWYNQIYMTYDGGGYTANAWSNMVGTVTTSEDGLKVIVEWDLFNFKEGMEYIFHIPAGYIVLENGAKNLETAIVYNVVVGTKDTAEFVVPEGMNGYINYDETDVNTWAPEFPFTVSTTGYNTIAFTAELPSLPNGLTSIEVVDDNNEVIATLIQDGVAPLADGEIYYVKGETTKEYVDGAELKFRFRFTHLGVSETIQFSYIVAGGNITSIADVELDGNVIVRGNDIIAPEGAAIFTVSGIRVPAEGLATGVYVVVLGNHAVRVMVK